MSYKNTPKNQSSQALSPWKSHVTACLDRTRWSFHTVRSLDIIQGILESEAIEGVIPGEKLAVHPSKILTTGAYRRCTQITTASETAIILHHRDTINPRFRYWPFVQIDVTITRPTDEHLPKTKEEFKTHAAFIQKMERLFRENGLQSGMDWHLTYVEPTLLFQAAEDRAKFLRSIIRTHDRSPHSARFWNDEIDEMVFGFTQDHRSGNQFFGFSKSSRAMATYDDKIELRIRRQVLKTKGIHTAGTAFSKIEELFKASLHLVQFNADGMIKKRERSAWSDLKIISKRKIRSMCEEGHAGDFLQWISRLTGKASTRIRIELSDPIMWPKISKIEVLLYQCDTTDENALPKAAVFPIEKKDFRQRNPVSFFSEDRHQAICKDE